GVEVVPLEHEVSAQRLLDGDERPIRRQGLAVVHADRGGRLGRVELEAGADAGGLVDRLVVGVDRLLLVLRQALPFLRRTWRRGGALMNQHQVLHRSLLRGAWSPRRRTVEWEMDTQHDKSVEPEDGDSDTAPSPVNEIYDPVLGYWITCERDGQNLIIDTRVRPGGGTLPHVHPNGEERFSVE